MGQAGDGVPANPGREPGRAVDPRDPPAPDALDARLRRFAEEARRFSRDFTEASGSVFIRDPVRSAESNVELAKALFSKWSIEILFALYALRELGFQELRDAMGSITPRVLSERLRSLEERGLVARKVLETRPTRVHYSLTDDGLLLARLGEPVFIFLKYRHDQVSSTGRRRTPRPRRKLSPKPVAPGGGVSSPPS